MTFDMPLILTKILFFISWRIIANFRGSNLLWKISFPYSNMIREYGLWCAADLGKNLNFQFHEKSSSFYMSSNLWLKINFCFWPIFLFLVLWRVSPIFRGSNLLWRYISLIRWTYYVPFIWPLMYRDLSHIFFIFYVMTNHAHLIWVRIN